MIRQRSFVTNNKENNAVISNIENENTDESKFAEYSYGKITTQGNNNSLLVCKNMKKPLNNQNSMNIDENYRYENPSSQINQDTLVSGATVNNGNNHISNTSNGSSNPLTNLNNQINTSITTQMLLNDVRAIAAQNQKTEQSLLELQRRISIQKGKRNTLIHQQEDKENAQIGDRKIPRNHSSSNQSYSHNSDVYQTNNHQTSNAGYPNKPQQSSILNPINPNYQNIPSKIVNSNSNNLSNNNDLSMNDYLNQKQKTYTNKQYETKDKSKAPTFVQPLQQQQHQQIQQQQQINQKKINKPIQGEKNLSDQQNNKILQQQAQVPQQTQIEQEDSNQTNETSKTLREENLSSRLARVIINQYYSHDILNYIKQTEYKFVPRNCLQNHDITCQLRAKMVDWMIEVMKSYKCSEESYFMAVRIMDQFLEKSKLKKQPGDLHLIGVTCIFIACKYEEIYPLRIKIVEERIAHKKLSEDQIKTTEAEILNTLNFNLLGTSPYEIAMQTLTLIGLQDKLTHQEFQYCHRICLYLSKMVLYDYEYFKSSTYTLLAASVIYIVFKIISQMLDAFTAEQNIKPVIQILKIDSKQLIDSSTRILNLAKNFDLLYPDLKNLKKFNGFDIKSEQEEQNPQKIIDKQ